MNRIYVGCITSVLYALLLSTASAQEAAQPAGDKAATLKASDAVIAAMAQFKPIVQSTLDIVAKGNTAGAKNEITKLEKAWDDKEGDLNAEYPVEWKLIDVAIDKALAAVRKPAVLDAEKSKAALQEVMAKLENPVATAKDADRPAKK